jgi:two-component system sensor histidine kinase KdpD
MKMKKVQTQITRDLLVKCAKAVLTVAAVTVLLLLIGRPTLGEAVIALLYVVPVGWSTSRWGQGPGMCAAIAAALSFDFFFIPPFLTFTVGSLEGWLVLAIFLAVAIVVVGRIQSGLSRAQSSEREAIFMYELSSALAGLRTQAAVAHTLAQKLQQMFQAAQVKVVVQPEGEAASLMASWPHNAAESGPPDRILPILNAWGLVGEIQVWRGYAELPAEEGRLLGNFALQAAQALERTRLAESEARLNVFPVRASTN